MTISVYQVDNVIKAYNKQTRTKLSNENQPANGVNEFYRDSVTISNSPVDESATYEKISYNIRDFILKSADYQSS